MNLVPGIKLALRVLRRDPDGVLPYYLAGAAVPLVGQAVVLAGGLLAYALLAGAGRIRRFVEAFGEVDFSAIEPPEPDPAAVEALVDAFGLLATPGTAAIAVVSMLLALVLAVVAGGVAGAAQIHAVRAALDGEPPLPAGVRGASRDAWRFVALSVLALLLYAAPFAAGVAVVWLAATASPLLAVLAALLVLLALVPALLAVAVALLFARQAVVIDDVGALRAVRNSVGFVRANPWTAAGFLGLKLAAGLVVASVAGTLAAMTVPSLVPLVSLVVLAPFVGLAGTAVYLDPAPAHDDPLPPTRDRLRAAFRRGLRTAGGFVRGHAGLVVLALAVFLLGTVAGWRATSALPFPAQTAPEPGEAFGLVPVEEFLNIAANNWRVAAAEAFAGVAAGVPTLANLLFNGLLVGALAGAGYDPVVFLALVAPHGVLEVPALAVAGGLGLSLGRDGWRYFRGRADADDLAASVERAFYVLLGLVPVFVLAAFVEAFVTPWVGAMVAG